MDTQQLRKKYLQYYAEFQKELLSDTSNKERVIELEKLYKEAEGEYREKIDTEKKNKTPQQRFEEEMDELERVYSSSTTKEKKYNPQNGFLLKSPVTWKDLDIDKSKKEWVWENYIAKGHVTLLIALYKSGKSTLIRALLRAMNEEDEFAGQPTSKENVLILTEETESDWVETRGDFEAEEFENIHLLIRAVPGKPNLKEWKQLVEEMQHICIEKKIGLVIIDTISAFMPIVHENDAGEWMPALMPLWEFTESPDNSSAVLLVHHSSKDPESEDTSSRGSGALPAFVSNYLIFKQTPGDPDATQRTLSTKGRFPDAPQKIVISLDKNTYKYLPLGTPTEVSYGAKLNRIMDILEEYPEGITVRDIARLWDEKKYGNAPEMRSIRNYLTKLINGGKVFRGVSVVVGKNLMQTYARTQGYQAKLLINDGKSSSPILPPSFLTTVNSRTTVSGKKNLPSLKKNSLVTTVRKDTGAIIGEFDENENFEIN